MIQTTPSPITYKPLFLWFLNDELEPDIIRTQIRSMGDRGCGGFFMHWLHCQEPFMSESWLKALDVMIEEAVNTRLEAWLYDEAWCPSCFAGGRCLASRPDLQLQTIYMEQKDVVGGQTVRMVFDLMEPLAMIAAPIRNGCPDLDRSVRIDNELGTVCVGPSKPYRHDWGYYPHAPMLKHWRTTGTPHRWCLKWRAPEGGAWRVYACFSRRMHHWNQLDRLDVLNPESATLFLQEIHEVYARRYQHHFGHVIPGIMIDEPKFWTMPWTPMLPELYLDRYQDDLIRLLPALSDPSVPQSARTRVQYHRLVSDLFNRNFIAPIGDWCRDHDLLLTGHISPEEDPSHEVQYTGSIHCHLGHFDIPGTDLIIQAVGDRERPALNLGPILASSVARQTGKNRVFTETGACCEESVSIEENKRFIDWQFALGVNLICFHGLSYSLNGFRKYLTDQTFSVYNNLWTSLKPFSEYIEKTSRFLSEYPARPTVAVLKPHTALRVQFPAVDDAQKERLEQIDESLIAVVWELLSHQIPFDLIDEDTVSGWNVSKGSLQVGYSSYPLVIVPPCRHIGTEAGEALAELSRSGGILMLCGDDPEIPDRTPATFWSPESVRVRAISSLSSEIRARLPLPFHLKGNDLDEVFVYHGTDPDEGNGFFMVNLGGKDVEFTLHSGTCSKKIRLVSWESLTCRLPSQPCPPESDRKDRVAITGPWQLKWSTENHIPLIASPVQIEVKEGASVSNLILDADEWEAIRDSLRINGKAPDFSGIRDGSFYDNHNRVLSIGEYFPPGIHQVEFNLDPDRLPTILLAGKFSACMGKDGTSARLEPEKESLAQVSRIDAGAPFLRGELSFTTHFHCREEWNDRCHLFLPGRKGAVSVTLDGKPVGTMAWRPDRLDLGTLTKGDHELTLGVTGDGIGILRGEPTEAGSDNIYIQLG